MRKEIEQNPAIQKMHSGLNSSSRPSSFSVFNGKIRFSDISVEFKLLLSYKGVRSCRDKN